MSTHPPESMPSSTPPPVTIQPPGTIVSDVEILLEFIGSRVLETGGKNANLPPEVLPELNERLAHPIKLSLKRALLKDYPNLVGPYMLLRVMRLVEKQGRRLGLNPALLSVWQALNPTEKYFALFEAWSLFAEDTIIGASGDYHVEEQFHAVVSFLVHTLKKSWRDFSDGYRVGANSGFRYWNVQLAARFGLMDIRPLRSGTQDCRMARGWHLASARRTAWADKVLELLQRFADQQTKGEDDLESFHPPEEASFGYFQPAFQAIFPDWRRSFTLSRVPLRSGLHVLKVTLLSRVEGPVWCRLARPGTTSLDEMAWEILKIFDFYDTDHAYRFSYRDSLGKTRNYYHPDLDEGPWAHEISLEELDLPPNRVMDFLFDFGYRWEFDIRLEKVVPEGESSSLQPGLLESCGTPPKQYPDAE